MSTPKWLLMLAVLVPLFVAPDVDARSKRKGVRAEIAALKARIAELESAIDFQLRRDAARATSPGLVPVGGLCADPCAADSDGDGAGDCEDYCPCDPANADGDGDTVPDCADPCPADPTDACIDPCRMDSDGDGRVDCEDPCPWTTDDDADGDGDGVPDCADPCLDDKANDCSPVCKLDADADGTRDCVDPCPWGETTGAPCVLAGARPAP